MLRDAALLLGYYAALSAAILGLAFALVASGHRSSREGVVLLAE